MCKKIFLLIGGIISLLIFIDTMFNSEPEIFFGYSINVWLVKAFWFLNTLLIFNAYRTIKQSHKKNIYK